MSLNNKLVPVSDISIDEFLNIFYELEQILLDNSDCDLIIPYIDRLSTKIYLAYENIKDKQLSILLDLLTDLLIKIMDILEIVDRSPIIIPHLISFVQYLPKFIKNINLNEVFSSNSIFTDELLNFYLKLLNCTRIKNYLESIEQREIHDPLLNTILIIIFSCFIYIKQLSINILDSSKLTIKLFISFIDHDHLQSETSTNLLRLLKVLHKRPDFTTIFIQMGYPQACLRWISESNLSYDNQYYILNILYNISRHNNGTQILNEQNALEILHLYKHQIFLKSSTLSREQYSDIAVLFCMIYALLLEPDELKKSLKTLNEFLYNTFDRLFQTVVNAANNEKFKFNCFHISEPLTVLTRLFVNDEIVDYILKQNLETKSTVVEFFCQLLFKFYNLTRDSNNKSDQLTLLSLCNLLWSISFQDKYKDELKNNSVFMTIIKLLTNDNIDLTTHEYMPRHLSSIRKATEGLLWNLEDKPLHIATPLITKHRSRPLAMISYSHANILFCKELVEKIRSMEQFDIWVDYLNHELTNHTSVTHSDDIWEEIAEAIEIASVIILIVSKDYYDSKSCRQELSYACDVLKKRIIPIYPNTVQKEYKATGWLGIRTAGLKYIHFGRKEFNTAVEELTNTVGDTTNTSKYVMPLQQSQPIIPYNRKQDRSLKHWTLDDISHWFDVNHIHIDIKDLYTFQTKTSLILYAEHLKLYYTQEYELLLSRYQEKYGKQLETDKFITFVDALYRLYDEDADDVKPSESKTEMTWF
ncbi:unnamed protein product [Didymodactylos carnosus]|uniref:TIR domain-containing protein n=1 Tax=Didymodactylos carnosus TaxID=1234261 RepID=A0A814ZML5_9BILA|nr:unnamed protein product [Didymodactylos carnosus]CAF4014421.1 unnamed protein product [Didymodactylos carnosus]